MFKTIIIADDHPVFLLGLRTLITTHFNDKFVIADEASNVNELLGLLSNSQPDILITDVNMPSDGQADGLQFIKKLRYKYPKLTIIVVTVLSNPGLLKAILSTGVYAVINKQGMASELISCLNLEHIGKAYTSVTKKTENHTDRKISPRELDVLRLLSQGYGVTEIASKLFRTKQTISAQKKSAMRKIGISSDAELFEYLRNAGL